MEVGEKTLEIISSARWYNQWVFSYLRPYLGIRILEVGCGIGIFTSMLLQENRDVVAVDVYQPYLDKIKSRLKSPRLIVMWADIEKNQFPSSPGKFDTILCLNVLEHIRDDEKALKNMRDLLEEQGKLLLLVPAHTYLFGSFDKNLDHFRRYSKGQLSKELKSVGFRVEKVRFLNWLGTIGWFINGKILRKSMIPRRQLGLFNFFARPFLLLEKFFTPPFGLSLFVVATKL